MDNQTLLHILTAFVALGGLSLLLQAVYMFWVYKEMRILRERVTEAMPKVEALVESSEKAVTESKQRILEVTAKANEILDSAKRQIAKVEEVVNDASTRAKAQMDRAEMVLEDAMTRAHDTVATVHGGIMRPIREIHGIAAGVRAALAHLAAGNRTNVAQATQDEEMFI